MQKGAIALIDALGFRGIWQRHDPAEVLKFLEDLSGAVDAALAGGDPEAGPAFRFSAAFLSDTIAIGLATDGSKPAGALLALAGVVRNVMVLAAISHVPMLYRLLLESRGGGSRSVTPRHGRGEAEGDEASNPVVGADGIGGHEAELS